MIITGLSILAVTLTLPPHSVRSSDVAAGIRTSVTILMKYPAAQSRNKYIAKTAIFFEQPAVIMNKRHVYLRLMEQDWPTRSQIQQYLDLNQGADQPGTATKDSGPVWLREHVLHPYFDFVSQRAMFPRSWHLYANKVISPDELALGGEIAVEKQRQQRLKQWFSQPLLRQSNVALVIWQLLQQRLQARLVALESRLQASAGQQTLSRHQSGPDYVYTSEQALRDDAIQVRRRSSIQMARICEGLGIHYFHFLQPNQYVAGSKTFTKLELKHAIGKPDYPLPSGRREGLSGAHRRRRHATCGEVAYFDLTGLFKQVHEDVYQDICCHMNVFGNRLMTTAIARTIGRQIESSP